MAALRKAEGMPRPPVPGTSVMRGQAASMGMDCGEGLSGGTRKAPYTVTGLRMWANFLLQSKT